MWPGPPLSYFDLEQSRSYFQRLLDKLDTEGIVLAGLELENEINMAGFNPDFRLPGEGRVLGLIDLYHDPEGQQVAKGYLQVLAASKGVRDHSKLNQRSPLLPTSLVEIIQDGPCGPRRRNTTVSARGRQWLSFAPTASTSSSVRHACRLLRSLLGQEPTLPDRVENVVPDRCCRKRLENFAEQ